MTGKRGPRRVLLTLVLVASLLAVGCTLRPGTPATQLDYSLPTTLRVKLGQNVPGTDIRYDRQDERGAYLLIKGQQALKRKGDSVDWRGDLQSGVSANLSMRVAWYSEAELDLAGVAKLTIKDVNPRQGSIATSSPLKYAGPVAYGVGKGATIPGSTLSYVGKGDDGAQLAGVEGYPYRKGGDSILWEGTLRDGVYLRLDLRVLQYDASALRVGGLATVWVGN
ncbi:MAG: hypothetical protein V1772_10150 [Chloroflexota bacterium]